jgi:hypothetical protein
MFTILIGCMDKKLHGIQGEEPGVELFSTFLFGSLNFIA